MLALIHIQWIVGIIFIILYCVTILGLVLVIITENRNPLKTIPWVIVLLLAPGIGLLFYFFFGQDNRKQRIISRRTYKRIMKRPQEGKLPQDACSVPAPYQPLVTLLTNSNQSSLLYGSDITIYTNGTDKFHDLLQEIAKATHHIHIQYYIFCDDEVGNKVKKTADRESQRRSRSPRSLRRCGLLERERQVLQGNVGCRHRSPCFPESGVSSLHQQSKLPEPPEDRGHRRQSRFYGWHEHCRPLHERDQLGDMERHALQDHRKGSTRLTSRIPYRLVCGQQETPERKDLLSAASGLFG